MSTPLVLVINRDVDTQRLSRFAAGAGAHGIAFTRVPALDAHAPGFPFAAHAHLIGRHFWGGRDVKPGALGCFLSHRRAWATLLDSGAPCALICEDDAVPGESLDRLSAIAEEVAADILFVNDRFAAWCAAVSDGAPHLTLARVVAALATRGGPAALGLKRSPGADHYLLSRPAAERLLALTAAQRIICGVDWAMLWNALDGTPDAEARRAFPELAILARHLAPADLPLSAVLLSRPVARQGGGASVLRHSITRPIVELLPAEATSSPPTGRELP